MELLHQHTTSAILDSFYKVVRLLPYGLDKQCYINALTADLIAKGLNAVTGQTHPVVFNAITVGQVSFDIVVDHNVLVKTDTGFDFISRQQEQAAMALLKVSPFQVLLLLNFGLEADFKRLFLTNDKKPI